MKIHHFHTKYKTALSELEKILDDYLQGLWYEYDYQELGQRSVISLEYFNDHIVADVIFAGRRELKLEFEEINDKLIVKGLCRYDTLSDAYSNDVLKLEFKAQGRTEKEMAALNIKQLTREHSNISEKITELQKERQKIEEQINESEKIASKN
jgi:hypothetical protein